MTSQIPLGVPICLKSHTGNNLQNEFIWRNGRCNNQNTQAWEQMVLLKTDDDKIIIQSRWNNHNLQVQESGLCVFANQNQDLWEKFDVEMDEKGYIYFKSCHTGNVMQCDGEGFARCVNKNRLASEAWEIINPKTRIMMTSEQLRIVALTAAGVVTVPIIGLTCKASVPAAMSAFGTVVVGVGTLHASAAAGGVAAILQMTAATCLTAPAIIAGALSEAALGAMSRQ